MEKIGLTRDWYEGRPRMLDCLRELTLVVTPADGRVWFTKVAVKPLIVIEPRAAAPLPGKAVQDKGPAKKVLSMALIGVATDEKPLLEMRDRLIKVKGVSDVKMQFTTRNNVKSGREVTFSLNFYYTAPE